MQEKNLDFFEGDLIFEIRYKWCKVKI